MSYDEKLEFLKEVRIVAGESEYYKTEISDDGLISIIFKDIINNDNDDIQPLKIVEYNGIIFVPDKIVITDSVCEIITFGVSSFHNSESTIGLYDEYLSLEQDTSYVTDPESDHVEIKFNLIKHKFPNYITNSDIYEIEPEDFPIFDIDTVSEMGERNGLLYRVNLYARFKPDQLDHVKIKDFVTDNLNWALTEIQSIIYKISANKKMISNLRDSKYVIFTVTDKDPHLTEDIVTTYVCDIDMTPGYILFIDYLKETKLKRTYEEFFNGNIDFTFVSEDKIIIDARDEENIITTYDADTKNEFIDTYFGLEYIMKKINKCYEDIEKGNDASELINSIQPLDDLFEGDMYNKYMQPFSTDVYIVHNDRIVEIPKISFLNSCITELQSQNDIEDMQK